MADPPDLAAVHVAYERARVAAALERQPKADLLALAADAGLDQLPDLDLGKMTKAELVRLLYGGTADEQRARAHTPLPVLENDEHPMQRAARLAHEARMGEEADG